MVYQIRNFSSNVCSELSIWPTICPLSNIFTHSVHICINCELTRNNKLFVLYHNQSTLKALYCIREREPVSVIYCVCIINWVLKRKTLGLSVKIMSNEHRYFSHFVYFYCLDMSNSVTCFNICYNRKIYWFSFKV